jgi:hypothetical protein
MYLKLDEDEYLELDKVLGGLLSQCRSYHMGSLRIYSSFRSPLVT